MLQNIYALRDFSDEFNFLVDFSGRNEMNILAAVHKAKTYRPVREVTENLLHSFGSMIRFH